MKVLINYDAHIVKTKDGKYWCKTATYGYPFFQRYLNVFDEVDVVARVNYDDSIDTEQYIRVDGKGVNIKELPFIRGGKQYILNYLKMNKAVRESIDKDCKCAIFRLPSVTGFMLAREYSKKRRNSPYSLEIIVDPIEGYSFSKISQILFSRKLKKSCMKANGVSYVTQYALQERYPSYSIVHGNDELHFHEYYSSIDLKDDFFYKERVFDEKLSKIRIIHVANCINADNKGHTALLKVVKELIDRGISVDLKCIGDGDKRRYYEIMAEEMGISENVNFLGVFASKMQIRECLINSDLFLFPTKGEGLPRVVIEAMATGLPCVSTKVNGIPELINSKYLFSPDDVNGMAECIYRLVNNKHELTEMSRMNFEKAKEYRSDVLEKRRNDFYHKLKIISD